MEGQPEPLGSNVVSMRAQVKEKGVRYLLDTERGFQSFRSFLVSAQAEENLDFWKRVELFREQDSRLMLCSSVLIWNEFLVTRAPKKVNVTFSISDPIRLKIEAGKADREMFDAAQQHIFKLFNQNNFVDYLWSANFKSYVNEQNGLLPSSEGSTPALTDISCFYNKKQLTIEEKRDLQEILTILVSQNGIKRSTRPFCSGVSFTFCFSGKDLTEWFKKNLKMDKTKAVEISGEPPGNYSPSMPALRQHSNMVFVLAPLICLIIACTLFDAFQGDPHFHTEREMIEVSNYCLSSVLKLYARRGWQCVMSDKISRVSKKKVGPWLAWRCCATLDSKKPDAFPNLWKSLMGLSSLPSLKLLEETRRTRVCTYNRSYPGVSSNVEYVTCLVAHNNIVDPTNSKETFDVIIETSVRHHESYKKNAQLIPGHVMYRGIIVEHTVDTTTITYIDLTDVGHLEKYHQISDTTFKNLLQHLNLQSPTEISDSSNVDPSTISISSFKEEDFRNPGNLFEQYSGGITISGADESDSEDSKNSYAEGDGDGDADGDADGDGNGDGDGDGDIGSKAGAPRLLLTSEDSERKSTTPIPIPTAMKKTPSPKNSEKNSRDSPKEFSPRGDSPKEFSPKETAHSPKSLGSAEKIGSTGGSPRSIFGAAFKKKSKEEGEGKIVKEDEKDGKGKEKMRGKEEEEREGKVKGKVEEDREGKKEKKEGKGTPGHPRRGGKELKENGEKEKVETRGRRKRSKSGGNELRVKESKRSASKSPSKSKRNPLPTQETR